jgi:Protein of unknown function DUF2834
MPTLPSRDKFLIGGYLLLAAVALVGTQTTLAFHFAEGGDFGSFLTDPLVNPASTFFVVDVLVVALAALAFLLTEGRRLGMRHLWVYVALTFVVAISVAFPLFLAARQAKLRTPV